ncbi:MAG: 50S ribosomal protein L7/L12 [Chloroflexi bacterium]|nr:50S ribosomal protein L7/L12 [Chloroflexota bacterium]
MPKESKAKATKPKVEELVDEVSKLTVLELSEFVKALEERFGVSAAPSAVVAAPMPGAAPALTPSAPAAVPEEKTEFDVLLKEVGPQKIQVIKVVRELTGLGLREAKDLVESTANAPALVKQGINQEESKTAKAKLEEVGAVVEVK